MFCKRETGYTGSDYKKGTGIMRSATVFGVLALTGMSVAGVWAQQTTQQTVLGASSNPDYPLQVEGGDGILYNCKSEIGQTLEGRAARTCIRATEADTIFRSGTGLTQAAPALALIVVGAAFASGSDSTTGSTTTTAVGN
jgi:uncharacterized iron-regulated membrane protein